ncbi:MAG: two-component sensor histidine kinase [Anaerocolumna sp.]|nr:two-component sensor histidine kinase [Anaerocolumna sp.]
MICFILGIIGITIISMIHLLAGIITFFLLLLLFITFLIFTKRRYQDIKELSDYLASVYAGSKHMDIRDNSEGELSILKNDIYKVTLTLTEQSELLRKDKKYLAETLSNISHQLKTPLTSMYVMTDLLTDPNLPDEKKDEFLSNITNQLKRIEWLVTSLLKLSKIDAKAVTFKKDNVILNNLISKAIEPLLIPAELKEITININCPDNCVITADNNWTIEAILNIIKNCIEHTKNGGVIQISSIQNTLYTELTITDNGEGIANDDKPYIFERFYKGKNAGPDSIGIGLAMSKSILTSQNATITIDPNLTIGTKFIIKFYRQMVS